MTRSQARNVCGEPPTAPMKKEAAEAGFYTSPMNTQHARIQILTIEELLAGKKVDIPAWRDLRTFKKAPKAKGKKGQDARLF